MYNDEQIVMTPTIRSKDHTAVTVERLKISDMDQNKISHFGGGDHKGIVIYKEPRSDKECSKPAELVLTFKVILRSCTANRHEKENWELRFWFKNVKDQDKIESAEAFLTELISSGENTEYPRDTIGFIKTTMKLMQLNYPYIQKVEIEMKKPEEREKKAPHRKPPRGEVDVKKSEDHKLPRAETEVKKHDERKVPRVETETKKPEEKKPLRVETETKKPPRNEIEIKPEEKMPPPPSPATSVEAKICSSKITAEQEKLLDIIEAVYPNSLPVATIAKSSNISDEEAQDHLIALQSRGLVKCLSNGNYLRTTQNDTDVKMVKQMPMVAFNKQPVIAIITAQYCEKLAVDAMIENKETFVKFKTEGESNVYTLGTVGRHRVVSTKLPATGMAMGAMIAAGSTTTRLLGSFPRVDYVFLVGIGGGVPHCYDYSKHVRLGDVVISTPPDSQRSYVYLYCEPAKNDESGNDFLSPDQISIKTWCPPSLKLQNIACQLWRKGIINMDDRPWEDYIEDNLRQLKDKESSSFQRPPSETDKIYCMSVEGGDLVDVGHPQPMEGAFDPRKPGMPVLHFGAVGSGRVLMQDDTKRLAFADRHGIMSFDSGFGSVVESIFGNRKDDYVFIRGISDYKDGTKKKEWQPYAALAAAAVMKAIICSLEV